MINMKTYIFCKRLIPMLVLLLVVNLDLQRNTHVNAQERFFGIVPSTDPVQNIAFVAAGAAAVGAGVVAGYLITNHLNSGNYYFNFLFKIKVGWITDIRSIC